MRRSATTFTGSRCGVLQDISGKALTSTRKLALHVIVGLPCDVGPRGFDGPGVFEIGEVRGLRLGGDVGLKVSDSYLIRRKLLRLR